MCTRQSSVVLNNVAWARCYDEDVKPASPCTGNTGSPSTSSADTWCWRLLWLTVLWSKFIDFQFCSRKGVRMCSSSWLSTEFVNVQNFPTVWIVVVTEIFFSLCCKQQDASVVLSLCWRQDFADQNSCIWRTQISSVQRMWLGAPGDWRCCVKWLVFSTTACWKLFCR